MSPYTKPIKYTDLIYEVEKGFIKLPQFQRDFVWSLQSTAKLLDSILKGFPIGTFILWETTESMRNVKDIGNLTLASTPKGRAAQYVLDGQQRITSLFAAYRGAEIQKIGEKKVTDYKNIVVNLDVDIHENDEQVVTTEPVKDRYISLHELMHLNLSHGLELSKRFNEAEIQVIAKYVQSFTGYEFSTVILKKESIDSAIEVFTRINTGGQTLTVFEIMSAKTYDESQQFDMQEKWISFIERLDDKGTQYETISSSVIVNLLGLLLSPTKECKGKVVLELDKQAIIDSWDDAISALEESIDYFRFSYHIPVSRLLPYDALLVSFAYFFFHSKKKPTSAQITYLQEFFWRMSLSNRYSSSTETRLAQDIKRIDLILQGKHPSYDDIKVELDSIEDLINTNFRTGTSYCKAVLCLLAFMEPKDFQNNHQVDLKNSSLKIANSKNYHHFFPEAYLKKNKTIYSSNSLMNITFISDDLNKRKIRAKAPSKYIGEFEKDNPKINKTLKTHLIELKGFGIENDDYETFLKARAKKIFKELKARIEVDD